MSDDPIANVMLAIVVISVIAGVARYLAWVPDATKSATDPRLVRAMELADAGDRDAALALWEEVIGTGNAAGQATAHACRGAARMEAGDLEGARGDLEEAVRLAPLYADASMWRGIVRMRQGDLAGAVKDAAMATRIDPAREDLRVLCGVVRAAAEDLAGASGEYETALRLAPESFVAQNNLAWLLATSADAALRDGPRAVQLATEACERTGWQAADCLGTLGAAKAECGAFEEAIRLAEQGIELVGEGENAEIRRRMLEGFRRGEAWRDERRVTRGNG